MGRDVESGRGLVGDQELGATDQGHGDHRPLAHAAGELVRIGACALLGGRDPHHVQHGDGLLPGGGMAGRTMGAVCLHQLIADSMDRVERGHGLLEDHGEAITAEPTTRLVGQLGEVDVVEQDVARRDPGDRVREQAHQRQRRDALAATRFADQPQRLALVQLKGDVLDGIEHAAIAADADGETLDGEHGRFCGRAHHLARSSLKRGSRRSRSTSPTRLSENTVRMMAAPGNINSPGARVM